MAYNLQNLDNWRNHMMTSSVQNDQGTQGSDFLSSESVVMFSGPASLGASGYSNLVPIGLVQNVQVAQQKQLNQLFEVGSRKPVFVPGRTMISGGIARILFDGPSLMYAMSLIETTAGVTKVNKWAAVSNTQTKDHPTDLQGLADANSQLGTVEFKNTSGSSAKPGYFFINLASSFFNKATGLGFALYDMEGDLYGGFYLENCYIQAHTFSLAAQQTVLIENVTFRASTMVPLDIEMLQGQATGS